MEGRSTRRKSLLGVVHGQQAVPWILYRDVTSFVARECIVAYEDDLIVKQTRSTALTRKVAKLTQGHGALFRDDFNLSALGKDKCSCRLADKGGRLLWRVLPIGASYHRVLVGDEAGFTLQPALKS